MDRRPCGSWPSPFAARAIAGGRLRLAEPRIDRGAVYWLEGRPDEGGRQALMCSARDSDPREITPTSANVRSRVHEYGGGAYLVSGGRCFAVDDASGTLCEIATSGMAAGEVIASRAGAGAARRYADFALSPDGGWLVAVEEEHAEEAAEPRNRLVGFRLARGGERVVLDERNDFVSSPCFSPNGDALAWLAWQHPDMPWDATTLERVAFGADGPRGTPRRVAGGSGESIFQPRFAPDGRLAFVSDRSGWWNLRIAGEGGAVHPVCPMTAEFAAPQWGLGMSRYDFADADTALCILERAGRAQLARVSLGSGELRSLSLPFEALEGVRVEDGVACFIAAGATTPAAVCAYELEERRLHTIASSLPAGALAFDDDAVATADPIEFPTRDGAAHAFYYAPRSTQCEPPAGERPPLLVMSHGGPTGVAHPALDLSLQYWTSRGFAVVDVNYGGSTSFGRAYRERLDGQWGVVDVEDCVAAANWLAEQGLVDPERLAITGGSAGGYTTLCALTFHDVFRAGASHYGIGDLEALARDTHKFESRYIDRLVAPYPEGRDVYRERSPIHFPERLSCPVIFFQGGEDRVVPPEQARAMVAALAERSLPHAYVEFPGEGHGFRAAGNIRAALEGELYFYGEVFRFATDVAPGAVEIRR